MKRTLVSLAAVLCYSVNAEPLPDFEALIKRCKTAFDTRASTDVHHLEQAGVWVKRAFGPTKFSYDVRKTDSLVTPFTAYLEISEVISSKRASDEATALALELAYDSDPSVSVTRINYAYQGQTWVVVSGQSSMDKDAPYPLSRERVMKRVGSIQSCF